MNAIIIRTLKNSNYNFANRTSSNMKKVAFKRIDNYGDSDQNGKQNIQNGHQNAQNGHYNNNNDKSIYQGNENRSNSHNNEKNSANEYNMCRFHHDQDEGCLNRTKAKPISSANKQFDCESKCQKRFKLNWVLIE